MILSKSSADVKRIQREAARLAGRDVYNTGYFGSRVGEPAPDSHETPFPEAFIVDQGPGFRLPPHFHRANQFQVFLSGYGTFGNQPVHPPHVHYAGAFTPYGPIVAGPEGVGYMTLRTHFDTGIFEMPQALPELRAAARQPRDMVSEHLDIAPSRPPAKELACRDVFSPQPDGLAAWHYRVPRAESFLAPDPAAGGGQFFLVLTGEMVASDGTPLPARSCTFVSSDEAPVRIAASAASELDVLILQFPA
jgi:hypothetical protein